MRAFSMARCNWSIVMIAKICLGLIAFIGLGIGVWASVWPLDFYGAFPGCGRTWVSLDGPYNEHLVRDTGALNLSLGVLAAFGLFRPQSVEPRVVGVSATFYALPHFIYHAGKLELYLPLDQALILLANGLGLAACLVLCFQRPLVERS
jgi:hypothetical protein